MQHLWKLTNDKVFQNDATRYLAVIAGGSAVLCLSGGGVDSRRTNKVWQSVRVHYSVVIRTLSIEEKTGHCICPAVPTGHCICPAILYEILALLTGHCVGYAVLCIS